MKIRAELLPTLATAAGVAVGEFRMLAADPASELRDFRMIAQALDCVIVIVEILGAEHGMDFAVTNPVYADRCGTFEATRHEVVLVHRGAGDHGPVTDRANFGIRVVTFTGHASVRFPSGGVSSQTHRTLVLAALRGHIKRVMDQAGVPLRAAAENTPMNLIRVIPAKGAEGYAD